MGASKRRNTRSDKTRVRDRKTRTRFIAVVGLLLAGAAASVAGWMVLAPFSTDPPPADSAAVEDGRGLQVLVGRWRRPDGGYVIEVRSVDGRGRVSAAYRNPRPIRVARAEAALRDGVPTLFIELKDAGYPGSTYTLGYAGDRDALAGDYYQAAMGQHFPVVFVRIP